jgi:hypothetical protein
MTYTMKVMVGIGVILALLAYVLGIRENVSVAGAPSGLTATVASTSQIILAANGVSTLFSTSSCAARVIATGNSAIMLTFDERVGTNPSGIVGAWQAASTTAAYDGGLFGCGTMKVYSFGAQQVRATETR